jgi:nitrite reductase/ring-hydroxylating ferredoxin subunit
MIKRGLILLMTIVCLSCGKNSDPIPDVAVYIQGSLSSSTFSKVKGVGVAITISGGVAGIIVYHRADGAYVAYDRCSSYQPEKKCAINIDSGDLTATDPCSGSVFLLYDGTPSKLPATQSLKAYSVFVDGYSIIIQNY